MQHRAAAVAMVGQVDDQKIKKRIGWLNTHGGFDNQLLYGKVKAAAGGVDTNMILTVLKEAEEKKADVKDVTAYVTSALRRAAQKNPFQVMSMPMHQAPVMHRSFVPMQPMLDGGAQDLDTKLR